MCTDCVWLSCGLMCEVVDFFFFFKQKTAYELRISDRSSDVCSSDLVGGRHQPIADVEGQHAFGRPLDLRLQLRVPPDVINVNSHAEKIGRASCTERVCQYV